MIIQDFYIKEWDWSVRTYYYVDDYYMDIISQDLELCGCDDVERTIDSLFESIENSGLTYSNPEERCSIIVIGRTSSPEEFQSTFDHEKGHLAVHIALTDDISWISEEYQYLVGEIGRLMYPVAKMFLCEHCINELHEFKGTLVG